MWAATPTRALAWPARRATRDSSFRRRRAWVRAGQTRGDETRDASADASSSILRPRTKGKHLDRPWHLTYLRNSGHATKGTTAQRAALRELWPLYGVDIQTHGGAAGAAPPTLNLAGPDGVFGSRPADAPVALEIGFGLGDSLVEMARAHPDRNFLGCEVHKPGIGAALLKIHDEGLDNVRLVRMDALWLLRDFIPPKSLSDVCVYFPDPWSDQQSHRRIVNPFLLALCESKMTTWAPVAVGESRRRPRIHVSTDDASHAAHAEAVLDAAAATGRWRKERVVVDDADYGTEVMLGRSRSTKYEERGVARGSAIVDLCFAFRATRTGTGTRTETRTGTGTGTGTGARRSGPMVDDSVLRTTSSSRLYSTRSRRRAYEMNYTGILPPGIVDARSPPTHHDHDQNPTNASSASTAPSASRSSGDIGAGAHRIPPARRRLGSGDGNDGNGFLYGSFADASRMGAQNRSRSATVARTRSAAAATSLRSRSDVSSSLRSSETPVRMRSPRRLRKRIARRRSLSIHPRFASAMRSPSLSKTSRPRAMSARSPRTRKKGPPALGVPLDEGSGARAWMRTAARRSISSRGARRGGLSGGVGGGISRARAAFANAARRGSDESVDGVLLDPACVPVDPAARVVPVLAFAFRSAARAMAAAADISDASSPDAASSPRLRRARLSRATRALRRHRRHATTTCEKASNPRRGVSRPRRRRTRPTRPSGPRTRRPGRISCRGRVVRAS